MPTGSLRQHESSLSTAQTSRAGVHSWVPQCLPGRSVLGHTEEPEGLEATWTCREHVMHATFETACKQLKNVQKRQHTSKQLKYLDLACKDAKT